MVKKSLTIMIAVVVIVAGCAKEGSIDLSKAGSSSSKNGGAANITSYSVTDNRLALFGSNMESIERVELQVGATKHRLVKESGGSTNWIGIDATFPSISMIVGQTYNLFITDAMGAAVYPITLTLPSGSVDTIHLNNGSVTAPKLAIPASDGQILWYHDTIGWHAADPPAGGSGGGGLSTLYRGAGLVGSGSSIADGQSISLDIGTGANQIPIWDASRIFWVPHTNTMAFQWDDSIGAGVGGTISLPYYVTPPTVNREFQIFNDGIFTIHDATDTRDAFTIDANGDIVIDQDLAVNGGVLTVGGQNVCLENGSNCPVGGSDHSLTGSGGGSGDGVHVANDGKVGFLTNAPTYDLSLNGNFTRTLGVERHSTADTTGSSFVITAGGATSGATNRQGGTLAISGGIATGNQGSVISFQTATPGGAGTTDNMPTTKMYLNEYGAVGIGTTVPDGKLEVVTATATENALVVQTNDDNTTFNLIEAQDSAGTSMLTVTADGKLSVGVATPTEALHVVGSIRMVDGNQAAGRVLTSDANGVASWTAPGAGADNLGNHTMLQDLTTDGFNIESVTGIALDIDNDNTGTSEALTVTKDNGITELFRVQEDGKVGIGTNAPTLILDLEANSTTGTAISFNNTEVSGKDWWAGVTGSANPPGTGDFAFYNATDGIWAMIIESTGNVGIGTSTPTGGKLQITNTSDEPGLYIVPFATQATDVFSIRNKADNGYILQTDPSGELKISDGSNNSRFININGPASRIEGQNTGGPDYWSLGYGANNHLSIRSGGNVGVGTTAPDTIFQVEGNSGVSYKATHRVTQDSTAGGIAIHLTDVGYTNPFSLQTASSFNTGDPINADFYAGIFPWGTTMGGMTIIGNSNTAGAPGIGLLANQRVT